MSSPNPVLDARPGLYIAILLAVITGSCAYGLRTNGLFACQSTGYESDRYAAYCQATSYGDYDHGAFWFGLEPSARDAAANASVLFLGNSRMQFGFSTDATDTWFTSQSAPYYLLGFSHDANHNFEAPLLRELEPRARAYVINLDRFFIGRSSKPVRSVMGDAGAKARYVQKRMWQRLHRPICRGLAPICGAEIAFFRSRATGAWLVSGGQFEEKAVSLDPTLDETQLEGHLAVGREFVSRLSVEPGCVISTQVPHPDAAAATAGAIAAALGLAWIEPQLDGLNTFDGSHLDRRSAERWSRGFIEAAGPRIRNCLDGTGSKG